MAGDADKLRLGVVGAGGFATFAVGHLVESDGVVVVAVADEDATRSVALAATFGAKTLHVDDLLRSDEIDVVYLATPPSSHAALALIALEQSKHVLCEKPLATTVAEADSVVSAAHRAGRFAVANLLQRYNPLARCVSSLIRDRLLGDPLRATLENYAADQGLPLQHWFWDPAISGGIFIEHGVHFFDLFASWFGPAEVLSSVRVTRAESAVEEQVRCTLAYPGGVVADMYHGFHQPTALDRTQIRLLFERGDITLDGWIPTAVRIEALVDDDTETALYSLFSDTHVERLEAITHHDQSITARHKSFSAERHLVLVGGSAELKMTRYGDLVHRLFADQLSWVRDPIHERLVDETASRDAVMLACRARDLACTLEAQPTTLG